MDTRRVNLEAQKARDYKKYKQFQKRFENFLKWAEDEEQLDNMTIGQLLNAYSKVEQMYLMRTDYREKYFTPDNWDMGHQQFIGYLVSVMNVYENELEERFEGMKNELEGLKSELEEERFARLRLSDLPEASQLENETRQLEQIMPKIRVDLENRRREEEEVWNVEIRDLIAKRREVIERAINFLEIVRKMLSKFKPDISEAETVHVYNYIAASFSIISIERLQNPDGTVNMKKLKERPLDKIVKRYPITFEEYAKEAIIKDKNYPFNELLKTLYTFTRFGLFPKFIKTILDITSVTREYDIYRTNMYNATLFVPVLPNDPNAKLSSIGKYVFALFVPDGTLGIMGIGVTQ